MRVVHKFLFNEKGLDAVLGPSDRVIHVALDWSSDKPAIWVERSMGDVFDELPVRTHFEIYGTGHEIPEGAEHVGSLIQQIYVWHIYKVPVKKHTEAELQEMGDL